MTDQPDPYAEDADKLDDPPIPGLGDASDDDTEGVVCMPADLVSEKTDKP